MIRESAAETEIVTAAAVYCGNNMLEIALLDGAVYGVLAIWCGTPFQILHVVNISSGEKNVVATRRK